MAANDTADSSVAIVGCGVIEVSWTAHYLARGFEVVATDPAPGRRKASAGSSQNIVQLG
jgi:carnitine 3-dehydrogenase